MRRSLFACSCLLATLAISVACIRPPTPATSVTHTTVTKLASVGAFDPSRSPVMPGGLTPADIKQLQAKGWKAGTTDKVNSDAYMVFRSSDTPGGFAVWRTTINPGISIIFDPKSGHAATTNCGNPTCWRWLVEIASPMKNEGVFDPTRDAIISGGLTPADRSQLEKAGWIRATTPDLRRSVEMAGPASDSPGGVLLRKFDVPKGTEYYYNPVDGRAVIVGGANATVWDWLANQRTDLEPN